MIKKIKSIMTIPGLDLNPNFIQVNPRQQDLASFNDDIKAIHQTQQKFLHRPIRKTQ